MRLRPWSLALASDFFCVLGLEPCVLDSTSDYQDKLETSKNNTAEVWRIIKSLLSSSRSDASLPQKLRHNNTFTTNPTLIANNFNDYFSDIGKILADQLKPFW